MDILGLIAKAGNYLILAGGAMFVLGVIAPKLSGLLPEFVQRYWVRSQYEDLTHIPRSVVRGFVAFVEGIADTLTLPWVRHILVGLLSIIAIANLQSPTPEYTSVAQGKSIFVYSAVIISAVCYFFNIRLAGPIYELITYLQLRRRKNFVVRASRDYERTLKSEEESEDEDAGFMAFLERQIDRLQREAEMLGEMIDGQDLNLLHDNAQAMYFRVFLVSLTASVTIIYVWALSFFPLLPQLFRLEIGDAWSLFLSFLPLLFLLFVHMQSLIPSFIKLAFPEHHNKALVPVANSGTFLFLLGIALSALWTFSALRIGHWFEPDAYLPFTLQVLVSNAVFDGVTLAFTVWVLNLALNRADTLIGTILVFFAIAVDIAAAAAFAMLSLWGGLLGDPEHQLTLQQCYHVLWGYSVGGQYLEFGPYFWVMHTSFLPTILYITMIVFAVFARFLATLTSKVFAVLQRAESPIVFSATGELVGICGGMLVAAAAIWHG